MCGIANVAGLESPLLQVAERELFMRYGWPWIEYLKSGCVLAQDESPEPSWAEIRLDYMSQDSSESGGYIAHVELAGHIECKYSTAEAETYAYPQYVVTHLERVV